MTADHFQHLRAIRSAELRLRFLREARNAYRVAMARYLAQLDAEIAREVEALTDAHTARVDADNPCRRPLPLSRATNS
jgi:hypothetical protein